MRRGALAACCALFAAIPGQGCWSRSCGGHCSPGPLVDGVYERSVFGETGWRVTDTLVVADRGTTLEWTVHGEDGVDLTADYDLAGLQIGNKCPGR